MDEVIASYYPKVKIIAQPFVGRYGAELDDLVQEGILMVLISLQRDITPSLDLARKRMKNWVRRLKRWKAMEYNVGLSRELDAIAG